MSARWAVVAALLIGCGGREPARVPDRPAEVEPMADGTILERAPCPVPADHAAFVAGVQWLVEEFDKAGLAAELEARPIATLFPADEIERLRAAAATGRCERILYASDGLRVVGYLFHAAGAGPHPAVFYLRGGNREFGKLDSYALLLLQQLADAGYTVVATQYRGVDGGEGTEQFGGADLDDVMALVPLARALPDVDGDQLYLLGASRGGMQGTLALRRGLPVRAAAFRGGMFDLSAALQARPELGINVFAQLIPGFDTDREAAIDSRSAIRWAGELKVPILLVHGRQDWRVDVSTGEAFAAALAAAGLRHKLVIYDRDEHQIALHRAEWIAEVVAWFRSAR